KVGHYVLKATAYSAANGSGKAGTALSISFSVTESNVTKDIYVSPIADAYVRDGSSANINFGLDTSMNVKSTPTTGNNRQAYLKFPLNQFSDLVSARLRIYGRNIENSSILNISVFGFDNDSWTESGITWNNAPDGTTTSLGSFGVNSQGIYFDLDVTAFVKEQFVKDKILSLIVKDAATQNRLLEFNSRE